MTPIAKIEADGKRLREISNLREELENEQEKLEEEYAETDDATIARFKKPVVMLRESVYKELVRGLKALGKVKIQTDKHSTHYFRLQGGMMYEKYSKTPYYEQKYIERFFESGDMILESIRDPELKADFDKFFKFCKANKKAILSLNGGKEEEDWMSIPRKRVIINSSLNYPSDNELDEVDGLKTLTIDGIRAYSGNELQLRFKGTKKVTLRCYNHVVQQLGPELDELEAQREKIRKRNCQLEIELANMVDECFRKWLVLKEI